MIHHQNIEHGIARACWDSCPGVRRCNDLLAVRQVSSIIEGAGCKDDCEGPCSGEQITASGESGSSYGESSGGTVSSGAQCAYDVSKLHLCLSGDPCDVHAATLGVSWSYSAWRGEGLLDLARSRITRKNVIYVNGDDLNCNWTAIHQLNFAAVWEGVNENEVFQSLVCQELIVANNRELVGGL